MAIKVKVEDVCPRVKGESPKAYLAFIDFCLYSLQLSELHEKYISESKNINPPTQSLGSLQTWSCNHKWVERREIYRYEVAKAREDKLYDEVDNLRDKWIKAMHLSVDKATEMMQFPLVEKQVKEVVNVKDIVGDQIETIIILKPAKWNSSTVPAYLSASAALANSVIGDLTQAIETCRRFGYEVVSKQELEELKQLRPTDED